MIIGIFENGIDHLKIRIQIFSIWLNVYFEMFFFANSR